MNRLLALVLCCCTTVGTTFAAVSHGETATLGDTKVKFHTDFLPNGSWHFKDGTEVIVNVSPKLDVYRGIYLADGSGYKRYNPAHVGKLWEFLTLQFNWAWQDRISPENPEYFPKLMRAIAKHLGHPELAHAPVVIIPRQAANKGMVPFFLEHQLDRLIAVGYGFGDGPTTAAQHGIPASVAFEIRNEQKSTWKYFRAAKGAKDRGSDLMITRAGEHGIKMHWANGKPMFGMMLVHQAIRERLPVDQDARKGPVRLKPMPYEKGYFGALDPVWEGWRQIHPVKGFKGDLDRHTWTANREHAEAWRGYMNPAPVVMITSPTKPYGVASDYLGIQAPLRAGEQRISIGPLKVERKEHLAILTPDPGPRLGKVKSVTIVQGERELGTIDGHTGSITASFGPGIHLLTPIVTFNDGSKEACWPSGMLVGGDFYADIERQALPARLNKAEKAQDWSTILTLGNRIRAVFPKNDDPVRVKAEGLIAQALATGSEAIEAALADERIKPAKLAEVANAWAGHPDVGKLDEVRERLATAAWEPVKKKGSRMRARDLISILTDWPGTSAAKEATKAYADLAKADLDKQRLSKDPIRRIATYKSWLEDWPHPCPAVDKARAAYEEAATEVLKTIEEEKNERSRLRNLASFAKRYPDTAAGAQAQAIVDEK